uniref:AsIV-cont00045-ORF1 n=1 Tax=Apophua simplicipes ichnovirus TaxID=1329648 RepID=S5DMJ4_9VIRU|nr:AsIV-cont00045-ORF1 [Apophua simplicipes ichnovirus]
MPRTFEEIDNNSVGYQDGFAKTDQLFIVKPTPENGREDEFLDLIMEQQTQVVVILPKKCPHHSEEMNYYWMPTSRYSQVPRKYEITLTEFKYGGNCTVIGVRIERNRLVKICHNFRILRYNDCNDYGIPRCARGFVHFVYETLVANREVDSMSAPKPIVVHSDGNESLAGVYCAIAISMLSV